jgi:hypothetical protein
MTPHRVNARLLNVAGEHSRRVGQTDSLFGGGDAEKGECGDDAGHGEGDDQLHHREAFLFWFDFGHHSSGLAENWGVFRGELGNAYAKLIFVDFMVIFNNEGGVVLPEVTMNGSWLPTGFS